MSGVVGLFIVAALCFTLKYVQVLDKETGLIQSRPEAFGRPIGTWFKRNLADVDRFVRSSYRNISMVKKDGKEIAMIGFPYRVSSVDCLDVLNKWHRGKAVTPGIYTDTFVFSVWENICASFWRRKNSNYSQ